MPSSSSLVFSKVLIANRGEIAVRVIRTCQDMGISTVAVYSEIDYNSLHVRLADEAYALPGVSAAESYLNVEAILEAVSRSKAEAVHPGYGFLSENGDFAQAVTAQGVTFVGPPPQAIHIMGDKISARNAAESVGVNSVPGDTTPIVDPVQVEDFAASFGWPVAVKAAYGGGGRGMKVIASPEEAETAIESARREAKAYFGRDELYIERYLPKPRHVEIQVLADSHGSCIYLGSRDCSAQRRHQKLIEEAPAPSIPASISDAMGEAAVKVAQGCEYVNAGTVEFLYHDKSFYYLEMNTRLQVEHPVTELITGVDLVEQQLRIAADEPLQITQNDVTISGHAIEVRVNAEDPANGAFRPSPGRIEQLRPAQGFGVRWDGGYEPGDEVSQFYDNLIGKLVVWGKDRDTAIARTLRALAETNVTGLPTTVGASRIILSHPDFAGVAHSTKWVEEQLDFRSVSQGMTQGTGGSAGATQGRSAGMAQGLGGGESATRMDAADASTPRVRREIDVEVDGKRFNVAMWVEDSSAATAPTSASDTTLNRTQHGSGSSGRRGRATRKSASGGEAAPGAVVVPMQGTVVQTLVAVGDAVEAGDVVAVLEAMKMENNLTAEKSGTVTEVRVGVGDSVGVGDIIAIIA